MTTRQHIPSRSSLYSLRHDYFVSEAISVICPSPRLHTVHSEWGRPLIIRQKTETRLRHQSVFLDPLTLSVGSDSPAACGAWQVMIITASFCIGGYFCVDHSNAFFSIFKDSFRGNVPIKQKSTPLSIRLYFHMLSFVLSHFSALFLNSDLPSLFFFFHLLLSPPSLPST